MLTAGRAGSPRSPSSIRDDCRAFPTERHAVKQLLRALSPRVEFAIVVPGAFGYFIPGNILAILSPAPAPVEYFG